MGVWEVDSARRRQIAGRNSATILAWAAEEQASWRRRCRAEAGAGAECERAGEAGLDCGRQREEAAAGLLALALRMVVVEVEAQRVETVVEAVPCSASLVSPSRQARDSRHYWLCEWAAGAAVNWQKWASSVQGEECGTCWKAVGEGLRWKASDSAAEVLALRSEAEAEGLVRNWARHQAEAVEAAVLPSLRLCDRLRFSESAAAAVRLRGRRGRD